MLRANIRKDNSDDSDDEDSDNDISDDEISTAMEETPYSQANTLVGMNGQGMDSQSPTLRTVPIVIWPAIPAGLDRNYPFVCHNRFPVIYHRILFDATRNYERPTPTHHRSDTSLQTKCTENAACGFSLRR
jgi:hypothetical protein